MASPSTTTTAKKNTNGDRQDRPVELAQHEASSPSLSLTLPRKKKNASDQTSLNLGLNNLYCTTCGECPSKKSPVAEPKLVSPTPKDILMGRGRPFQSHPGNMMMRQLVEENKARYNRAHRDSRGAIANELLDQIHESGARFLKRRGCGNLTSSKVMADKTWEEASRSEAYEKLCHALRSRDKSLKSSMAKRKSSPRSEKESTGDIEASEEQNSTDDLAATTVGSVNPRIALLRGTAGRAELLGSGMVESQFGLSGFHQAAMGPHSVLAPFLSVDSLAQQHQHHQLLLARAMIGGNDNALQPRWPLARGLATAGAMPMPGSLLYPDTRAQIHGHYLLAPQSLRVNNGGGTVVGNNHRAAMLSPSLYSANADPLLSPTLNYGRLNFDSRK